MSEKRKDKKGRLLRQNERQRSNGMYEYRYIDGGGTKHSVYSWRLVPTDRVPSGKDDKKPSLRELEDDILREISSGINPSSSALTLNECFDLYMQSTKLLQRKTRDEKVRIYKDKIKDVFGKKKISKIARSDVRNLYIAILESGGSMDSVTKADQTLSCVFENAIANRAINYNPCNGVVAELKRVLRYTRERKHSLTIAEQNAFLNYISGSNKHSHWYPFFKFMLGTGCRIGEALGLTWDNCDFENGVISIDHAIRYYKLGDSNDYGLEITKPKTSAGVRIIPMLDAVRELLLAERDKQSRMLLKDVVVDGMTGFVWRTTRGTLPIPGTINAALYTIQKDYNLEEESIAKRDGREPLYLPKFSVHVLRHTFCTRLCENESNVKVIQEVMGHASIVTTMNIYNEATMDAKRESFEKLNGKII